MLAADEQRAHAARGDRAGACQGRALADHQLVAADARRRGVLLHRGALGVELLDRLDVRAGFDARDEALEGGGGGHYLASWAKDSSSAPGSPSEGRAETPSSAAFSPEET